MTETVSEKKIVGPVTAATGGGVALATIICWLVAQFTGIDVPVAVQGSLSLLLGLAGGYLVPTSRSGSHAA